MATPITFKKATKKNARLRLAICGPAGSGKTFTALKCASEFGGKVALIDTERGSASLYSDQFDFDVIEPERYNPEELIQTIDAAVAAGYTSVVIDSLSHYWMGPGGELDMVDNKARSDRSGNSFTAWKSVTPIHNDLMLKIMSAKIHVIVTMRTKTEWVIEENDKGKKVPRKIGLSPVMRDGVEFEFHICGDMDQDNILTITKSRCVDLSGKSIRKPGKEFMDTIKAWLNDTDIPAAINQPAAPSTQANALPDHGTLPPRKEAKPTAKELGDWIKEQRTKLPTEDNGDCKQITRRLAEFGVSASDAPTRAGEIALLIGDSAKLAEFRAAVLADVAAWAELQNEGTREVVA